MNHATHQAAQDALALLAKDICELCRNGVMHHDEITDGGAGHYHVTPGATWPQCRAWKIHVMRGILDDVRDQLYNPEFNSEQNDRNPRPFRP